MTRLFYSIFASIFLMIACQSSTPEAKETPAAAVSPEASTPATTESYGAVPMPGDYAMKADTIVIRGKFQAGCTMPKIIKIAEHNELNSPWKEVAVNPNGEFVYKMYLAEPRRIAIRTEKRTSYDFIGTTKEKNFVLDITCTNGLESIELKNSAENLAYRPFNNANKKFRDVLDSIAKLDMNKPEVFAVLKTKINDYHKTLNGISSAHPNTFTGMFLCAAEKLPDGSLNSLTDLRKNFLNREVFANPHLYNDFLGQRILLNYLSIADRNADQTEQIAKMMNIAAKNVDASKRLQQITYNIFYNRHEEQLMTAYVKWADTNPTALHNPTVKGSLQRLKRVIAGNTYIDIELKDPAGAPKKLSQNMGSKLTLLVFYSPTCDHCQAEIPQLKPMWQQYKSQGFKIYAVAFDATKAEWDAFIAQKGSAEWVNVFEYPDGPMFSYQYVVNYTPTYIFIDAQGKIVKRFPTFDDVKRDLPALMK